MLRGGILCRAFQPAHHVGYSPKLGCSAHIAGNCGDCPDYRMAVDANVLVFERIREEFKISGRLASAIQAGYRKAFSAIIDSNITTIIAALILIHLIQAQLRALLSC